MVSLTPTTKNNYEFELESPATPPYPSPQNPQNRFLHLSRKVIVPLTDLTVSIVIFIAMPYFLSPTLLSLCLYLPRARQANVIFSQKL